jgi:hypothetical protein
MSRLMQLAAARQAAARQAAARQAAARAKDVARARDEASVR